MPRLWITKDNRDNSNLEKVESKEEERSVYIPEVKIIRPEVITHIPPGLYSCTCLDYNDISYLNTLVSSGKIGLGTQAGTDRSIAAEFGDSAPHLFYQELESEVSHSGGLKFSDFYGASGGGGPAGCNPPVTNCLWTHYDFSGCSTGTLSAASTTSAAMEQQCLRAICSCCRSKLHMDTSGSIVTLTSNGVSNNYWCVTNSRSFKTCAGNAFWGCGTAPDNSMFVVWKACNCAWTSYYTIVRWNQGFGGYRVNYYSDRWYPFYSGHTWMPYRPPAYNRWYNFYVYGSNCQYYGATPRFCGYSNSLDLANDSNIVGHRICTGQSYTANNTTYNWNYIDKYQNQTGYSSAVYSSHYMRYYQRFTPSSAGGFEWYNGGYTYYCATCLYSRTSQCFMLGESLVYKCRLTDTEWNDTFTYLKNKWSVTGGTGTC